MFAALGRLTSRRPWFVIAAWVVLGVLVVLFHPTVKPTTNQADFLPHKYESVKATSLMNDAFPQLQSAGATVVFDRTDRATLTGADETEINNILADLPLPKVFAQGQHPTLEVPQSRKAATANLALSEDLTGDQKQFDQVKDLRDSLAKATAGTGLRAQTAGTLPQYYDQSQSGSNAERIVMVATVILIVVLLGLIFRSVIIAIMPIVLVAGVSLVANGLIDTVLKIFDLQKQDMTSVILIVVLYGIGTDYILFFLFRYREKRREGAEHHDAVAHAVTRAGEAIASAGSAVVVAFLALVLSSLGMFRSIGPSLAIAVATTLVAALTLVPAVVTVLGKALFWPSKKWREPRPGTQFAKMGRALSRHPVRYALASGGVLVILSVFALGFNPSFDLTSASSATNVESARATDTMKQAGVSAGQTSPTPIVLQSDKPLTQDAVNAFAHQIEGIKGVAQLIPFPVDAANPKGASVPGEISTKDSSTALVMAVLNYQPGTDEALAAMRDHIRPDIGKLAPAGTTTYVGGLTSVFVDFESAMYRDYTVVFPVAAVIILLMLALLLRSLVAPWYLMISVGLGFTATLGATTLVFQNIKGDQGLLFMLPILIYLFVVALGTDYNILMITRLREEAREGKNPREAAAWAIRHSGPTIASAGVILAGTFASLMLAGSSFMTTMGFSIAFGIVVAAFVMASVFTPALTALIGHTAWWPGHSDAKDSAPEGQGEPVEG